ncbi:GTPase Era [Corynebacterium sp. 320]|uniref:GTPase Era n=1 Tax=Corynebacterium TaxID=1716 RepID=UPI00125CBDEE|nr:MULTISPECIES: GTPase Era [Corynebacterium]KAB1502418.1 GTPase Era [Corynebacterium sp. 320]KAB1551361.1 GTPase Era [Corynebacterium sp. 321]KAB1551810.1 GTPase Era [Corynebacterium sp. 319]KAB3526025.1 GTPase Era [Corynebacterium sp. 250]KAB3538805.1 GTPase Era [Corynebacterium sp. 366]
MADFPDLPEDALASIDDAAGATGGAAGATGYDVPEGFRSGFVSFVGRPNTGKSTLTNALVGQKIAITADQPETTRHPIRGIIHRDDAQVVVVDTPGLHRPRTLLGERLNEMVKETYQDVDVIALCVPADEKIGPGDRWIVEAVRAVAPRVTLIGIVTKVDKVGKDRVGEQLIALHELLDGAEVVPVSSTKDIQLNVLLDVLVEHLPEGPKFYPDDHVTDDDRDTRMAELIREAALAGLHDELPHSVAVQIDEVVPHPTREGVLNVHAVIYVEREGQKAILRGKGGRRLSKTVHDARLQIIEMLGTNIYLDVRLKVAKNWQSDPKQLGRLGF